MSARVGVLAALLVAGAACAGTATGPRAAASAAAPAAPKRAGATTAPAATPDAAAARPAPAARAAVESAPPVRFFVAGPGTLELRSAMSGDPVRVVYRRADGSYDDAALARVARALRSKDGTVGPVEPRLVELLAWVQARTGVRRLQVVSGYRSPAYNAGLRAQGRKAASASLHTEGFATDVALPKPLLLPTWEALRAQDCCGAGLYVGNGFLHVDVGPSRFWEAATSRVDENLSAGNARLFARTDWDRYAPGDDVEVTLHFLTTPPVLVARQARLVPVDGGDAVAVAVTDADGAGGDGCIEADARTRLRVAAPPTPRARIVLATCTPRVERTPEEVATNPVDVR